MLLLLPEGNVRCWACGRCSSGENKNGRVRVVAVKVMASGVAEISATASMGGLVHAHGGWGR